MTTSPTVDRHGPPTDDPGDRHRSDRRGDGPEGGPSDPPPSDPADPVRPHRLRTLLVAAGAYLVVSVAVWWNVWSTHPTSVTTCGCGDTSLFTWFLEWPAYAIAHGLNPLYSQAMFHPGGVNLLSNTSEVGIGVVLAPVTWIWGPVATLNVALTLSPVLSALAMFVLLRRWVAWSPAAFVGGLLYGFSPVIIVNLIDAHLMVGFAAIPPLVVLCLDELLVRQRRRPVRTGVGLGLLLVAQFFVGTELLLIMLIVGVVAVGMVVVYAAVGHPDELRRRARHAAVGVGAAAVTTAVLLAYPLWFVLRGPAHLVGLVWPDLVPGLFGIGFNNLVRLDNTASETMQSHRFGGYQGIALHQTDYLGFGLLAVLLAGLVIWRRDRRLWLFTATGLVSYALTLTVAHNVNPFWVPWQVLRWTPLIQNILPDRFMSTTLVCVAILFGIIVDRSRTAAVGPPGDVAVEVPAGGATAHRARRAHRSAGAPGWRRVLGWIVPVVVVVVALVPMADFYRGSLPLTVRPVVLPEWFRTVAPHLGPGQVVLSYPSPYGGFQASLTWQAVDRMSYDSAEGGGPGGEQDRLGEERPGAAAWGEATSGTDPWTTFTPATAAAVRDAVRGWGVTRVVVPDQPGLPPYEVGLHTSYAVGLMTAALGQAPRYEAGAWVWDPATSTGPATITPEAFRSCVGTADFAPGPPETVPACVLSGSG